MKPKIVAFCGVIGSGKDYNSKKYIEQDYKHYNFADPLKNIIFETLKIKNIDENLYELFKTNYWNPNVKIFPSFTGRDLLQFGNTVRKYLGQDVWVNAWHNNIKEYEKVTVSDCRYYNEAKKIISLGGEIFFCDYRSSLKYNSKTKFESEIMAQKLLSLGFKDGDNLTDYFIKLNDEII